MYKKRDPKSPFMESKTVSKMVIHDPSTELGHSKSWKMDPSDTLNMKFT